VPNPLPITGTVRGFPGSMSAIDWAAYDAARGRVNGSDGLVSSESASLAVTPGGGTRDLSVAAGEVILPGLRVVTTAAQVVGPGTAGAAGVNRMDLLVLEADWAANSQAGEARLRIVNGNNAATPPSASQNLAANLYQLPIARALLRGAATAYAATDIVRIVPLPRWERRYEPTITIRNVRGIVNWATLATAAVSDPGWPYRLDCRGQMRFEGQNEGSAFGVIRAYDATAGASIAQGMTAMLDSGGVRAQAGRDHAQFSGLSETLTGARTVTFDINQNNAGDTSVLTPLDSSANYFVVIQRPSRP
jgi:hypothetical protein